MVRLDDNDFNSPDLIDRVIPNVTLAVSTSFSSVRSQLGFYRIATLQLSFRVMCSQNFYGSDCTVFCLPQSSDALGHFTCNSVGERICSNEYTGADCRTRMFVLFVCFSRVKLCIIMCKSETGGTTMVFLVGKKKIHPVHQVLKTMHAIHTCTQYAI